VLAAVPVIALLCSMPVHAAATAPAAPGPDTVVAVVNGRNLTLAEFNSFVSTRIGEQQRQTGLNQRQTNMLFTEFINRELVYQDAVKRGWDKMPEVETAVDNHRRDVVARYALREQLNQPVSEAELEKAYRELKPVREFKARHILVRSEPEAQQVVAALDGGKAFEAVAKESSIDASAAQGGEIGWIAAEQLSPPLRAAVTDLKKGGHSKPVQTEFGWHVLRVDDTRIVPTPPFAELKDNLRRKIHGENIDRYVGTLREAAKVEVR
jgi:peptidyl-prolyl cis-trans isomerase C